MNKDLQTLKQPAKEYLKANKTWTRIVDATLLFRHSLKKTLKSKFTIIWFAILSAIIISLIITTNLLAQGTIAMVGFNVVAVSLLMLLTIAIFNIINLNDLFSNDHELGIMNLELRKGQSKTNIFLSRLAVNKLISLGYILVMMAIYAILTAIINIRDLNLVWMFLTYLPIDLVVTGVFLFFFGFFKYKTAISFSSVLLILILITPLGSIVSQVMMSQNNKINSQELSKTYAADQVLNLAYTKNESSFAYNLLNDAQYLNNPLIGTDENDSNQTLKAAWKLLVVEGLITDFPALLDNFWNEFQIIADDQDEKPMLEFSQDYNNSFFATLNNTYAGQKGSYEQDYQNSLYLTNKVNNANYQKMMDDLNRLIKTINHDFGQYQDVKQFNDLVLEYAQGMLYNGGDNMAYENYWDPELKDWIRYPAYLQTSWTFSFKQSTMGYLDQEKVFQQLTIPPALRMWNQISIQLIGSALNYQKADDSALNNKDLIKAYLIPWTAEFESWFVANPNLNFYQYLRMDQAKFNGALNGYLVYNYPSHLAITESKDSNTFAKLQEIVENDSQTRQKITGFSVAGFNLAITAMAIILMAISYFVFNKKVKK